MAKCFLLMCFLFLVLRAANICTDDFVSNSRHILIDTISVPRFQQTTSECVISSSEQKPFISYFDLKINSEVMSMTFQIKDIFMDRQSPPRIVEVNITGDTKILLSTDVNHEREEACLHVYSKNGENFNISCHRSTMHSTKAPTFPGTFTPELDNCKMENCLPCVCCLFFLRETQSQPFCGGTTLSTVNICTDNVAGDSFRILIDTVSVPKFQQTSCECVILSPEQYPFSLYFNWKYYTDVMTMKFQIQDISIDRNSSNFLKTNIKGDTKILLSTNVNHGREGACLAVYSGNGKKFSISCKRSNFHSSQAPTSTRSVTTDKENEGNIILLSVVSELSGLGCCLVIAFVIVIFCKRKKKQTVRKSMSKFSPNTKAEGDYYMTENPMYDIGQSCIIGTNTEDEINHEEYHGQYAGTLSCHYESIPETTDEKELSDHPLIHAVNYDYAECQLSERNKRYDSNIERTLENKEDKPMLSRVKAEDDTVYDAANLIPHHITHHEAIEHNDDNHLSNVFKTEKRA